MKKSQEKKCLVLTSKTNEKWMDPYFSIINLKKYYLKSYLPYMLYVYLPAKKLKVNT